MSEQTYLDAALKASDHPEHDKLAEVAEVSQAIGEFLDMGPYVLCEASSSERRYYPVHKSITTILAEWFGIDLTKLEAEKRAMIAAMQAANTRSK